jgi:hypothetical protein
LSFFHVKKSSRYKKEYAQSSSAWKKYVLITFVAFVCGGGSVLAYHFFFKAPQNNVPTVEGYAAPSRTYVAPQNEKTVQKIYDLDQSVERPIVEKILPSQDPSDTVAPLVKDTVPSKSTASTELALAPKVEPQKNSEPSPVAPKEGDVDIESQPQKPLTPLSPARPPLQSTQESERKPPSAVPLPSKHIPGRRIQVGPIFEDLPRAKAFLARLQTKAKGYTFVLQAREVQKVMRYRLVTQHPLTPSQIQSLTHISMQISKDHP